MYTDMNICKLQTVNCSCNSYCTILYVIQVYDSGIFWLFEMCSKTILAMLYSPNYALKYVSCQFLQIKNTDAVQDFNHMVYEVDLFKIFLLGSGPSIIDKACFMVQQFCLAQSGHIYRSYDSRFDENFFTTTIQ